MPKRIIVLCDGTSNTAYNGGPYTHVHRMWRYILPRSGNIAQDCLYLSGVGTAPGSFRKVNQAFGIGLTEKVMEAYGFICQRYEPGDDIIVIGYSRGAYTARCIMHLIVDVGLLKRGGLGDLRAIFDAWWDNDGPSLENIRRKGIFGIRARSELASYPIKACGLFDTVRSLGADETVRGKYRGPLSLKPDRKPMVGVEHAFHALSLNERRGLFPPTMMGGATTQQERREEQGGNSERQGRIEECWFSGYHSDVGGGRKVKSPKGEALAWMSLAWMLTKLEPFIAFDWADIWQGEIANLSWSAIRPRRDGSSDRAAVSDSLNLAWKLLGGTAVRNPGQTSTTATAQNTHKSEFIHPTVYDLSHPFSRQTSTSDPATSETPSIFPVGESLRDVIPSRAIDNLSAITWKPAQQSSSAQPSSSAQQSSSFDEGILMTESGALPQELLVQQAWVHQSHDHALNEAQAGDEEDEEDGSALWTALAQQLHLRHEQ